MKWIQTLVQCRTVCTDRRLQNISQVMGHLLEVKKRTMSNHNLQEVVAVTHKRLSLCDLTWKYFLFCKGVCLQEMAAYRGLTVFYFSRSFSSSHTHTVKPDNSNLTSPLEFPAN